MNRHPNILFMISDDHRYNAIRCYGNPVVQTQALDALAESGTCFRETRIMGGESGAVCVPSRACIHTGVNPFSALLRNPQNGIAGRTINPELALFSVCRFYFSTRSANPAKGIRGHVQSTKYPAAKDFPAEPSV